ncbi:MAG: 16S rRNA (cytosine(967)-C(5))-methyltransferase RsmB [Burkholderiaceae bacterium]|nr:MAG: 16S rRNA (cytosine(967)-C(5))-methyltransferase RsmB [Burkholderiaceae bacterium]
MGRSRPAWALDRFGQTRCGQELGVIARTAHPAAPAHAAALWRLLQATAGVVQGVTEGRSATPLLERVAHAERAGTQALAFDVLRHLGTASALASRLARRAPTPAVAALLKTALALAARSGTPPYTEFTLVDQTVEAAKRAPALRRQAGFVNACLRRFLRERTALLQAVQNEPVARWNHPAWWVAELQRAYPDRWKAILNADQTPAPMDVRVNARRLSAPTYCERLARQGVRAWALGASAVRLAQSLPVQALPGHAEGDVSVQSATAQRAAPLLLDGLDVAAPRVLDACAAPGGKTAHLLEFCPAARVTALDVSTERSCRIRQNLDRLGLAADIRVADAGRPADWWDRTPYDAILLDAPCSASGIVRRHPDVRWLRRASDLADLAAQQDRLLHALWPLLSPGGRLLFCTCSVFPQEGDERIAAFGSRQADAVRLPAPGHVLPLAPDAAPAVGDNAPRDGDGFFFALLRKELR